MNTVSATTRAEWMSWVTTTTVLSSSMLATSTSSFDDLAERDRIEPGERLVHEEQLLLPHELLRDGERAAV